MDKLYRTVDEKEENELQNRKAYNAQNTILEKNKQASNHKLLSKLNLNQGKIDQKLSGKNELINMDYEENKSEENNIDDELNELVKILN